MNAFFFAGALAILAGSCGSPLGSSTSSSDSSSSSDTATADDTASVAADKAALALSYPTNSSATALYASLSLPTTGAKGSAITWKSSAESVVSAQGTVVTPATDTDVTLTATIAKGKASDTKAFPLTAKHKVTITVLNYADTTATSYATEKAIWDQFQADNPGIALSVTTIYGAAYHTEVQADISAGSIPDLLYTWPYAERDSALFTKGLVKDLSTVIEASFLASFNPLVLETTKQYGGKLYQLPQSMTITSVLYANKKLLTDNDLSMPASMSDMKSIAATLGGLSSPKETLLLPDNDLWPAQSCLFSTILARYAGDSFIDGIIAGTKNFSDADFKTALSYYASLFSDGVIAKSEMSRGYGDGPTLFAAGSGAFIADGDWRVGAYTGSTPLISAADQSSNYEIVQLPPMPNEKNANAIPIVLGNGYSISSSIASGSEKEAAVVKLFKYIYGKDVQQKRFAAGSYVPARLDLDTSASAPLLAKLVAFYKNSGSSLKSSYVIDAALDSSLYNLINTDLQKIGLGTTTVDQTISDLNAALTTLRSK
jgi:ABC-type sugar transport system, periplasmic component